ncbi:hypothetical protein GCM10017607_24910 [Microbacterium thalassium]|nr:hypothetical protein GCM10017607_24910 [Microbacterium thalassium]
MTTVTHSRDVHIDAPVERVFDYIKHPENFYEAMHGADPDMDGLITKISMAPDDGVGSIYEWKSKILLIPFHSTTTREEFVPNVKIVDHTTTGVTWTYTVAMDGSGTKLGLRGDVTNPVPGLAKIEDSIAWDGEEDLDKMLATYKESIEALP